MLALVVELLTGRYVATAFDDRGRAEWPPHPARLFSALVATHYESEQAPPEERAVLEWMEALPPPQIVASEASHRDVLTFYVPVNDTSIVSSVADEGEAVENAREALERARAGGARQVASAEKKLAKAEARFAEAVRKAVAPVAPGKEGKDGPKNAEAVLPERRVRQPRTFPSVTPATPRLVFGWPSAEPSDAQRACLDALTSRVVRLGHSSSLVSVHLCDAMPEPSWVPDETGEVGDPDFETMLRVVGPGQLAALDAQFSVQADEPGRVMPAAFHRYVRPSAFQQRPVPTSVFGQDWVVLRRVEGPRLPSTRGVDVAKGLRSALLKFYGPEAPEILCGHPTPGTRSTRPHLAIVPLPRVGDPHADGTILGVALVIPAGATQVERRAVYRALDSWQRAVDDQEEAARLPIHLGRAGVLSLVALEERATQRTLRSRTWCARATRWATATPVALDRNPGALRASDPQAQRVAYAHAEETIALACEHIGLPRPARVTATPAAPLIGGHKIRQFPPYSTGKPPVPRLLVHATLSFDEPVEGPILLGAGRYLGLGLFRPLGAHA